MKTLPMAVVMIWGMMCSAWCAAAETRPNVLFIAIDDLANALGCLEDPLAQTPHMDALAKRGVLFQRAYCQIPLCNPSRASVLTGLRPDATGVYDLVRHFREQVPDVVTLPQLFRQQGYFTARVGKIYHYDVPFGIGTNGLDDSQSWDEVINPKGRDCREEDLITNAEPQRPISAALSWLAAAGEDQEQTDGLIAAAAIGLLEQHRHEPFFLGVGFFRPHTPYVAPRKYFELYPFERMRLPIAPADDRDDIPPAAFAHNCRVPNYGLNEMTCRAALQAYYACVSFVDAQVGRVIDALDRLHLAENTVIVLWSDHGYHLGEHLGIWQKRTLFEESARAPLIVVAPGAKGNGTPCPRVVEFVDIYPTLAELCRLAAPSGLAGQSLCPLLADPHREWDSLAVSQILRPGETSMIMGRSVRTQRWRYTEWNAGAAGAELYDHSADPHEFHNLSAKPELQPIIRQLREELARRAQGTGPETPVDRSKL